MEVVYFATRLHTVVHRNTLQAHFHSVHNIWGSTYIDRRRLQYHCSLRVSRVSHFRNKRGSTTKRRWYYGEHICHRRRTCKLWSCTLDAKLSYNLCVTLLFCDIPLGGNQTSSLSNTDGWIIESWFVVSSSPPLPPNTHSTHTHTHNLLLIWVSSFDCTETVKGHFNASNRS